MFTRGFSSDYIRIPIYNGMCLMDVSTVYRPKNLLRVTVHKARRAPFFVSVGPSTLGLLIPLPDITFPKSHGRSANRNLSNS